LPAWLEPNATPSSQRVRTIRLGMKSLYSRAEKFLKKILDEPEKF
jgi:hypothetical protein